MAYVRNEQETVEMDFPLDKVWENIKKTIMKLEWSIEATDNSKYRLQAKTKSAFLSYATTLAIEAKATADKVTRVTVVAETPVTTITSVIDFGKTRERVDMFLQALALQLNPEAFKPK